MPEKTIHIPGIHCEKCAATIKSELLEIEGVRKVHVDVSDRSATISWSDPATWEDIELALEEIDYPPAE